MGVLVRFDRFLDNLRDNWPFYLLFFLVICSAVFSYLSFVRLSDLLIWLGV